MIETTLFHFTTNLSGGGAETQMLLLANGLKGLVSKQYVIYKKKDLSLETSKYEGICFLKIDDFVEMFREREIKNSIFHIWIPDVFTYIPPFFFLNLRAVTVLGVRNVYSLNNLKRIYQFLCYSLFTNIVGNTPINLHSLIYKSVYGKKFRYIPNAIKYPISEIDEVKNKYKDFLFVGRIVKQKGIIELIEVFNSISDSLTVVGTGEMQDQVDKMILGNNIHLVGYDSEPLKYYKEHKYLVLPSYYEGMPNVAFEALSQNCLLIISDIPQNRLWFNNDQVIYFEKESAKSLKKAIMSAKALNNSEIEAKVALAKESLTGLTKDAYVSSYLEYYSKLLLNEPF